MVVRVRARTNMNPSPDSNPDSSPGPSPIPSSNLTLTLTKCRRRGYYLPRTARTARRYATQGSNPRLAEDPRQTCCSPV